MEECGRLCLNLLKTIPGCRGNEFKISFKIIKIPNELRENLKKGEG